MVNKMSGSSEFWGRCASFIYCSAAVKLLADQEADEEMRNRLWNVSCMKFRFEQTAVRLYFFSYLLK